MARWIIGFVIFLVVINYFMSIVDGVIFLLGVVCIVVGGVVVVGWIMLIGVGIESLFKGKRDLSSRLVTTSSRHASNHHRPTYASPPVSYVPDDSPLCARCNKSNSSSDLRYGYCGWCGAPIRSSPISSSSSLVASSPDTTPEGGVYLLKSGRHYKIGKTKKFDKRIGQLKIQLPEKVEVVHKIPTRDEHQEEQHWHRKFAHKRKNGEWFELSDQDVREFKGR